MTTTNLSDFGHRELHMASALLAAMSNGLPDDFYQEDIKIMMNKNSGNVFLTNNDFQVAMMHGNELEMFYHTPYSGHEGFADELKENYEQFPEDWHDEDVQYLKDLGTVAITMSIFLA